MNIYEIRQKLKTGIPIYEIELDVGYYARVSTDKEEQKNSIINQEAYFKELISKYPKWRLIRGYVDDGVSGLHAKKREDFHRMLEDSRNGAIDLILTKEITRFARNTLDSIMYTREMLNNGTCIWFINDNINTIDEDSELRLTIMSGIAQDEVRKLSSRVRFGHAQSIKKGVVLGNSWFYGYDKKGGKLIVNEKEAEMIRIIFDLYASGKWSTSRIEKRLYELGYRNHNGKRISNVTIQHIIQNPKYKGYYCGGKVKIVDMFTKKQEFVPKDEWVMYKDSGERVPAIVSEELWDRANKIYDKRSRIVKEKKTSIKSDDNLLTGKMFCEADGAPYWLKSRIIRGKPDLRWTCSNRIKNGIDSCPSFVVNEQDIRYMLSSILNYKISDFSKEINEYISEYKKAICPNITETKKMVSILEQRLEDTNNKKDKLLDLMLSDVISKDDYRKKKEELDTDISSITNKIKEISRGELETGSVEEKIKNITCALSKYSGVTPSLLNRKIVEEIIDKITILPTGDKEAKVTFYLNDGENFKAEYSKNLGSSSNIMLKMLPEQHISFKRNLRSCFNHELIVTYHYTMMI